MFGPLTIDEGLSLAMTDGRAVSHFMLLWSPPWRICNAHFVSVRKGWCDDTAEFPNNTEMRALEGPTPFPKWAIVVLATGDLLFIVIETLSTEFSALGILLACGVLKILHAFGVLKIIRSRNRNSSTSTKDPLHVNREKDHLCA